MRRGGYKAATGTLAGASRSRAWRLLAVAALAGAIAASLLARPSPAFAHPLGNFTINRYSRIELTPDRVRVRYVFDMAEIPAFSEIDAIDTDRDGQASEAEVARYAVKKQDDIVRNLRITLDGSTVPLQGGSPEVSFPPGQGGLSTVRFSTDLTAPLADFGRDRQAELFFRDDNFSGRLGWKEVVVRAGDGVSMARSTAPGVDESNELRSYPQELLKSPLDRTEARATVLFTGVAAPAAERTAQRIESAARQPVSDSGFVRLISEKRLTAGFVAIAIVLAIGFGALHSLGPGHGKTVVAAYLIGSRGTPKHALFLGLTVTATHTSTVFALGLLTLFAERFVAPERIFLWLGVASGLMVVAMGLFLFVSRLRKAHIWCRCVKEGHEHDHDHGDEHAHDHGHHHGGHDHGDDHDHGPGGHSHLPPGADGGRVTWRSLLALGISGGLLPCPSALVVMLGSIALNRVGFGLVLVIAFSVGLAGTLTAIGLLFVGARNLSHRFQPTGRLAGVTPLAARLARVIPVGSAMAITAAGLLITVQAFSQSGLGI